MAKRSTGILRLLALFVIGSPGLALAQVDCSDPDNLCTGDPCVIGSVSVASPCVADFGGRAVVVAGTLRVPSSGSLSLSGNTITVDGSIAANHSSAFADGADVELTAIDDVMVNGVIITSGGGYSGAITIDAGGDVALLAPLKTSATPDGEAGAISVHAGGLLHVGKPIVSKGSTYTDGGSITLSGDVGVVVDKPLTTSAGRGLSAGAGGDVQVTSSGGMVTLGSKINTRGADSGNVTVTAASTVFMSGSIKVDDSSCKDCFASAGVVKLTSTADDVEVDGTITARAVGFYDPTIAITAAGEAHVTGKLRAPFRGDVGNAGNIAVTADVVTLEAPANLNVASPDVGGVVRLHGDSVNLGLGTIIDAHGAGDGIGEVRIRATAGDATLSGMVVVGGGDGTYPGIIEATASGNLTADGDFRAAPTGCIGMSAGGTLDTSAGSFDRPVVADCAGSPSGAFVD